MQHVFHMVWLAFLRWNIKHFLQHEIDILNIQYKVPDNLALLPVVTDVITGNIFSMNTEADVYLLAALFPTMWW